MHAAHGHRTASRLFAGLIALLATAGTASADEPSPEDVAFFEAKIRPLLAKHCTECHGADAQESELRLDTYAGMIAGGASGPAVTPGKTEESLLLAAVGYQNEHLRMPPEAKLPDADIALLTDWIRRGAPHPDQNGGGAVMPRRGAIDLDEARRYWAFRPIVRPALPEGSDVAGLRPIDALHRTDLAAHGLAPNPPADRRTLLRRATFDLTGLPPTPEETAAFLADDSPQAFGRVVERLLASPHYGERWGRHWLDVVRYADSNGQDENLGHVDAWRYRNYVIDAFNADKPFDRFLAEQIAGDLLFAREQVAHERTDGGDPPYDLLVATGFLALGPKVLAEKDEVKMEMDIIDEQIDALGQSVLGLTIACARCHDHKFDPVSTADYYALAGILKSTRSMQSLKVIAKYNEHTLATADEVKRRQQAAESLTTKQAELAGLVKAANAAVLVALGRPADGVVPADAEQHYPAETREALAAVRRQVETLTAEAAELPTAMGVAEGTPTDLKVHVRGSHLTLGRSVARNVPEVLRREPLNISPGESGRLQLAEWLTGRDNPLTARVAVNRLWRWHFGEGLVPTTDNFGRLGAAPVNAPLLDWLAAEFVDAGWSVKAMHRRIMLSDLYRMSSAGHAGNAAIDPDNRRHWRANVRRLEAEAIRDATLAVSGRLDRTRGGAVVTTPKWTLVFDHTSKDATTYDTNRRSVYLPVIRNNLYDAFSLFDYANADVASGSRDTSTVAPQALFLLNSGLLLENAAALADRLLAEVPETADLQADDARVRRLYELALARPAEPHETERFLQAVRQLEESLVSKAPATARRDAWAAACQSVLISNEFLYVP